MADEQAQLAGALNQNAEVSQNGSEAVKTPDRSEAEGLKAEMLRERQARQTLEQQLQNPDFIYDQAKALGMATSDAEAQAPAPEQAAPAKPQVKAPDLTWELIETRLAARQNMESAAAADNAEQIKDHPELQSDPVLNDLYNTYAKNMRFSEAASKVLALNEKRLTTPEQQAEDKSKTLASKANATTGTTGTVTTAEADTVSALQKQASNRNNPSGQSKALFELLRTGKL